MKIFIPLFLFIFMLSSLSAQDQQLKMKITGLKSSKDSIMINFDVINLSDKDITVYTPDLIDICSGLLRINFTDLRNNKTYNVTPCNYSANVKFLELNCKNSLVINAKSMVNKNYTFSKSDISPYLKKNTSYVVSLGWFFSFVDIRTSAVNYFNDNVVSNYVLFISK